jgi:hypothetical protein
MSRVDGIWVNAAASFYGIFIGIFGAWNIIYRVGSVEICINNPIGFLFLKKKILIG